MNHETCNQTGKKKFSSKKQAMYSLKTIEKYGGFNNCHAYLCSYCNKWHIGHVESDNFMKSKTKWRKVHKLKCFDIEEDL